jgi:hypothetical protein
VDVLARITGQAAGLSESGPGGPKAAGMRYRGRREADPVAVVRDVRSHALPTGCAAAAFLVSEHKNGISLVLGVKSLLEEIQ